MNPLSRARRRPARSRHARRRQALATAAIGTAGTLLLLGAGPAGAQG